MYFQTVLMTGVQKLFPHSFKNVYTDYADFSAGLWSSRIQLAEKKLFIGNPIS